MSDSPITVEELAHHKRLPPEYLGELGVVDTEQGVEIPYYDDAGEEIARKLRTAIQAKLGSFWPRGVNLMAYGAWCLERARHQGRLIIVEGESDCWALWHNGYPALGLPGSNTAACLTLDHILGIRRIWIHREPDAGGLAFRDAVVYRLAQLEYPGYVQELRMIDGKDPSDLHVKCHDAGVDFRKALDYLLIGAPWVDLTIARHFAEHAKAIARLEAQTNRMRRREGART